MRRDQARPSYSSRVKGGYKVHSSAACALIFVVPARRPSAAIDLLPYLQSRRAAIVRVGLGSGLYVLSTTVAPYRVRAVHPVLRCLAHASIGAIVARRCCSSPGGLSSASLQHEQSPLTSLKYIGGTLDRCTLVEQMLVGRAMGGDDRILVGRCGILIEGICTSICVNVPLADFEILQGVALDSNRPLLRIARMASLQEVLALYYAE